MPVVLLAIVIVVAIIAVVGIGRAILNRDDRTQVVDDSVTRALLNTEVDRSVRMTVRGPITADEDFRSYQIEVSPIGRRMTIYQGYQGQVIENNQLGNSSKAYAEFVHALALANFTKEAQLSEELDDIRGVCAAGRLYTFELLRAQTVVKQTWTSNCRDIPGSFRGEAVAVRDLFQGQIPNSQDLLRDLDI